MSIREAGYFVAVSMDTWRKLGLSVTPKAHIFEYHSVDSTQPINGLVDKTKDFFVHQIWCMSG